MELIRVTRQLVREDGALRTAIIEFCMTSLRLSRVKRGSIEWYKVKKNRILIKVDRGYVDPFRWSKRRDYWFLSFEFDSAQLWLMIPRNRGRERSKSLLSVGTFFRTDCQPEIQVKVTRAPDCSFWNSFPELIYSSCRYTDVYPLQCHGCTMSNFKSAVCEAREGRASLRPADWMEGIAVSSMRMSRVVDVFICKTIDCGSYGVCFWAFDGKNISLHVRWDDKTANRMQKQRDPFIKHVMCELDLSSGLANIVLDFLMPRPGKFPPAGQFDEAEEIKREVKETAFPTHGLRTIDKDKIVFGGKEPSRAIFSCEDDRGAILYRYLGGKEVWMTCVTAV